MLKIVITLSAVFLALSASTCASPLNYTDRLQIQLHLLDHDLLDSLPKIFQHTVSPVLKKSDRSLQKQFNRLFHKTADPPTFVHIAWFDTQDQRKEISKNALQVGALKFKKLLYGMIEHPRDMRKPGVDKQSSSILFKNATLPAFSYAINNLLRRLPRLFATSLLSYIPAQFKDAVQKHKDQIERKLWVNMAKSWRSLGLAHAEEMQRNINVGSIDIWINGFRLDLLQQLASLSSPSTSFAKTKEIEKTVQLVRRQPKKMRSLRIPNRVRPNPPPVLNEHQARAAVLGLIDMYPQELTPEISDNVSRLYASLIRAGFDGQTPYRTLRFVEADLSPQRCMAISRLAIDGLLGIVASLYTVIQVPFERIFSVASAQFEPFENTFIGFGAWLKRLPEESNQVWRDRVLYTLRVVRPLLPEERRLQIADKGNRVNLRFYFYRWLNQFRNRNVIGNLAENDDGREEALRGRELRLDMSPNEVYFLKQNWKWAKDTLVIGTMPMLRQVAGEMRKLCAGFAMPPQWTEWVLDQKRRIQAIR